MLLASALLVAVAFLVMEGVAWTVHRYVMHSAAGWVWHRSHHEPSHGFELNDLYAVVFAGPAVTLFWIGAQPGLRWAWFLGFGATLYGLMYALVHDGLVHQRLGFRFTPKRGYLKTLVQAHRLHHAVHTRDGAVSFGFLYAPDVRRLKARLKAGGVTSASEEAPRLRPVRAMNAAPDRERTRQTLIGLALAGFIVAGWLTLHIWGVFFWRWTPVTLLFAPLMIAAQSWLGAGLFIVAHDAMHGTLAPGRRKLGAAVGQFCLGIYAGFSFSKLNAAHHRHHRAPGTVDDPDFHATAPTAFWPWYLNFFRTYFGWREMAVLSIALAIYLFVFKAPPLNTALFWGVPAIVSSLQLFAFGTWLPHRHAGEGGFADEHRARTIDFGWWASLLTCFHFGYHLEHHLSPQSPWWRLPSVRAKTRSSERRIRSGQAEPFTIS